ncbi:MAG: hypothetical protein VB051_05355 [Candidatus Pelethousia sp.]|nr:hypothetical protein [Candidatus Pelethousia sp.]
MPYMHKRTFEIIQDSNIDNELDDYFEVDELIALPIQTLNLKGYKTEFCCSGHSFPSSGETFAAPETKDYENFIGGTYKTNIVFADGSALLPVPNGDWYYDGNALAREY